MGHWPIHSSWSVESTICYVNMSLCYCVSQWFRVQRWAVTLARFLITGIPPFLSLNTSLKIKTVISKVLITVSISRLKIWESRFQAQYHDSNFKSLKSSRKLMTQLSKVLITVSIYGLNSWLSNHCPNLETVSTKQKLLENVTTPMWKILLFGKIIVTFELMLQFDAQ